MAGAWFPLTSDSRWTVFLFPRFLVPGLHDPCHGVLSGSPIAAEHGYFSSMIPGPYGASLRTGYSD